MERIRSFVAIEIPDDVKATLGTIIERLQPGKRRYVKWVEPASIHLTLKFLGDIDSQKVPDIAAAIERVAGGVSPMNLRLGGPGMFPSEQRPRVIWIALEGDIESLAALQREIEKAMKSLGFPLENRAFTPHLTLGRVRDYATPDERKEIAQSVKAMRRDWDAEFTVGAVSLMQSTLTSSGAIYDRLGSAPFHA